MGFVTLNFKQSSDLREFVRFWSVFYRYPQEALYAGPIVKSRFSEEDLLNLFKWKNGSRLSERKQKAFDSKVLKVDIINSLKNDFSLVRFNHEFETVSAIWKIFLLHIILPETYPIFDQHVCRAFSFIRSKHILEIPQSNKAKETVYFDDYVPFFDHLAAENRELPRKKIDEALWVFGKFLKTEYGEAIVNSDCSLEVRAPAPR